MADKNMEDVFHLLPVQLRVSPVDTKQVEEAKQVIDKLLGLLAPGLGLLPALVLERGLEQVGKLLFVAFWRRAAAAAWG